MRIATGGIDDEDAVFFWKRGALYYRVDLGPYLPSIELGLIGLTVYISYYNIHLARLLIIFYTFY